MVRLNLNARSLNRFIVYFQMFGLITLFPLAGCKKEAGWGGKKILKGTVTYFNGVSNVYELAPNASLHLAFGKTEAVSSYDLTLQTNSDGSYLLKGLNPGNYYLTAEYTDSHGFHYSSPGKVVSVKDMKKELIVDIALQ